MTQSGKYDLPLWLVKCPACQNEAHINHLPRIGSGLAKCPACEGFFMIPAEVVDASRKVPSVIWRLELGH